ncbi:Asp-tRNA(Asn)/Glu-tRNA(Gln) amidotransferase subunit GatC [Pacificimonas flava]|uniref:Aspartyl/glutamyl-tRNA(Asn/Gln) amidotransferase subunit C n=1 Tax=Pacificimonas flava TaxID=1234595 RepID=M2T6R6_9SPHN|nr:Asp-tRNA(Asn)/Glu-tRNA(Gln) amidotransferase subunit GatC [Pacificimonas flava]EMD82224.1 Aspartyl-tRNA(Asn) amidotransferase subunit C [Pacificimonas flava]MBB5280298.1 aspartyl-tRNA(Asn)/glutamyl-tRNA(Gln) amidotransferase subunit C [Pacificimonas flava]
MSIGPETVRKIAHLARIQMPEERVEPMAKELSNILDWVEQLGEVNTDGVEPLSTVIPNALRWREDAVTDGGVQDKVLSNAPKAMHGFFAVPKVIE